MEKILLGILILICAVIFWQDVKNRAVQWFMFPMLLAISLFLNFENLKTMDWFYNVLFLIVLMGSLTVYLTLKHKKLTNITKGFFSWGDILFLLAVVPVFDTITFMMFFTFGTIVTLLIHLFLQLIRKNDSIPYAGYMSLVLIGYFLFENHFKNLNMFIN